MKKLASILSLLLYSVLLFSQQENCVKYWDTKSQQEIYTEVDVEPEPQKGSSLLYKNIRESIKIDSVPEGTSSVRAQIQFVICPDGSVTEEKILYDNTNQVGQKMINSVKRLKWKSGKCGDKQVPTQIKIPLIACFK